LTNVRQRLYFNREPPRLEKKVTPMNLKALNLKWALAFAGAAVVGVVGVVVVLSLIRGGDEQATAQSDSATATPPATATVAPLVTATPLATAPGQRQFTPIPAVVLPYRIIVSGPDTAHPGEQVTYEIDYECVREASDCEQVDLGFGWTREAASLVESSPPGGSGPPEQQLQWAVSGTGVIRVVLKVAEGFTGNLYLDAYTPFSGMRYSDGSVVNAETRVGAEATP
jgi:hypothetical protein